MSEPLTIGEWSSVIEGHTAIRQSATTNHQQFTNHNHESSMVQRSTVTTTGSWTRTVTGVPAGNVAALRPPAATAPLPAPAPTMLPIAAPFPPPRIPPMIAPPIAPPPILAALSFVGESPSR